MDIIVSASVLSADVCRLGEELDRIKANGCDHVHFDVMDGMFVPNISYGIPMLKGMRKRTDMFIDAHLMITNPLDYIKVFSLSGADMISFHLESQSDPAKTLSAIKAQGKKAGIALKPATPAEEAFPCLHDTDVVLVMTVEPGFGGQGFMTDMLDKIRKLKTYIDRENLPVRIQVDGGINAQTAALVKQAGASILVAGSYLFGAKDMSAAARSLRAPQAAVK